MPPAILIAPGGTLDMVMHFVDAFGGDPMPGYPIALTIGGQLSAEINVDGPVDTFTETSQAPDGAVVFSISGGGCSTAGAVTIGCFGNSEHVISGAKSPDIDGDCIVEESDRLYVETMMGTDDFCADLDNSGLVDIADDQIVADRVGNLCDIVGVGEASVMPPREVHVAPNPTTGVITIRVDGASRVARARILDVTGRQVRELGTVDDAGSLRWDARDGAGRQVAPGRYYVQVTTAVGARLTRAVSLLR